MAHNIWWQRFVEVTAFGSVLTAGHCYLLFLLFCCVFRTVWRFSGSCCAARTPGLPRRPQWVRHFSGLPRRERLGAFYILLYCIFGPTSLGVLHIGLSPRFVTGMPPKKRVVDTRGEDEVERESAETELAPSSPASSGSFASSRSCASVTTEQLERILEANHKSMTALLASMSHSSSSAGSSRASQIKIPKWTDEEIPNEYFTKFEKALKHNGVEKNSWGQLLPVYLAGRAQAALAQVDADDLADYESVKETLLDSLGDTPASADRKWWSLSRQAGEEPGSF